MKENDKMKNNANVEELLKALQIAAGSFDENAEICNIQYAYTKTW